MSRLVPPNPWATGAIDVAIKQRPDHPGSCLTCMKTGAEIERRTKNDRWECSHVDCPKRRPITATISKP